jgi:hypothetical protein
MNVFSAAREANFICNSQTFGKKENVTQYWGPGARLWLRNMGKKVKLPCQRDGFGSRFLSDESRWRMAMKDQTIIAVHDICSSRHD